MCSFMDALACSMLTNLEYLVNILSELCHLDIADDTSCTQGNYFREDPKEALHVETATIANIVHFPNMLR
jgi:hypothetical protein